MPELSTREIPFQLTELPGQGEKWEDNAGLTGQIVQVIRHWPAGCQGLVDIAIGHGDATWVFPDKPDTFVALDSATPVTNLSEPIKAGEKVWVVVRNRDSVNPHTVSVTVILEGNL
jgi:hypothetical protein